MHIKVATVATASSFLGFQSCMNIEKKKNWMHMGRAQSTVFLVPLIDILCRTAEDILISRDVLFS